MALYQNQMAETPVQGEIDLLVSTSIISCNVKSDEATPLIPGQAVIMVDSADGVPKVTAATADTNDVFGFVVYNQKDQDYPAGSSVEIAFFRGVVLYMTSNAAFARNAKLMIVVSGSKVATATSGKTIIGRAIDKATAGDQLVRVLIDLPGTAA